MAGSARPPAGGGGEVGVLRRGLTAHQKRVAVGGLAGLALLALAAVVVLSLLWLRGQTAAELQRRLGPLVPSFSAALAGGSPASEVDAACKSVGAREGFRLTIIRADGIVLGDTEFDPAAMLRHDARDEVHAAMAGGAGQAVRRSKTAGRRYLYVAVPLRDAGRIVGVLRGSLPTRELVVRLAGLWRGAALWIVAAAVGGAFWVARGLGRAGAALSELARQAQAWRQGGQYGPGSVRLERTQWSETGAISDAMNDLALRLSERIAAASRHQSLETAILSSMVGSVLALDAHRTVISINEAASRLFGIPVREAIGCRVEEVVRIDTVLEFLERAAGSEQPLVDDLRVPGDSELFLRAHATRLLDAAGASIGLLSVLYDVTRLHRLEVLRKEFVANVSHELKTPITAIKGFVETLLAEIESGSKSRAGDRRFLTIIAQQADRLDAIVDDLLSLARIEQGAERRDLAKTRGDLCAVIEAAFTVCRPGAQRKRISLLGDCPAGLSGDFDARLLEQALVNLIDNAVKYSDEGSEVEVAARSRGEQIEISVRDHGCGIAAEHLERLFERFYRVDKARSRAQGGTGLGLAIVKHIAQAHGGSVAVDSSPGVGSVFYLRLPHVSTGG